MADKEKDQNVDPMKSIFDFIFAQTQKPADKRRPVRVSNISGASELTDALTTVLEKPGLHVADQAMNNLNDALSLQIAEIYTGSGAPQQKTKIFTKDLFTIFSDQNKFFDKIYEKNKRKIKLADYAGKSFRGLTAASLAKKLGIDDWDDRWAINRAAAEYKDPSERLAVVNSARKIGRKYLAIDSFTKGSEGVFQGSISGLRPIMMRVGKDLDKANIQNSTDLRNFLERDRDFSGHTTAIDEIVREYRNKEGKFYNSIRNSIKENALSGATPSNLQDFNHWEETLQKGFKDRLSRSAPENINMFREISRKYYGTKGHLYKEYGDGDDPTKGVAYDKMALLMRNWKRTQKEIVGKRTNELKVVKGNIKTLKGLAVLTPNQQRTLDKLKKVEKELKSEVRFLNRTSVQDKYYQAKGYWGSMKDVWGKNLGASILDGTFFSDDNKILNPVSQEELGLHLIGKDRIYFNINDKDNTYCRAMTTVMYLTPKKLLKMDGTYFAYRAYRNRMNSFNKLVSQVKGTGDKALLEALYHDLEVSGLFGIKGGGVGGNLLINYDVFNDATKLNDGIDYLRSRYGSDPNIGRLLDNYLRREGSLSGLVATFSIVARFKENLKRKIDTATIGRIRGAIAQRLLTRFGGDLNLKAAIIGWKEGSGIQGLIRGFVDKFLKKMGFQTIALTTLGGVLTTVLANFAFKFYILFAKVLVTALIGLIFLLGMGFSFGNSMIQKYSPVSHVTPGEVIQCQGFESEELVNPTSSFFNSGVQPAPSNSTCPLGDGYIPCTQGFIDVQGWSHQRITHRLPVDLAYGGYIYAPQYCDTSKCTATYMGRLNCKYYAGDKVYFSDSFGNTMIMFHVAPVGAGAVSSGGSWTVKGGEAFARVQTTADGIILYPYGDERKNPCWTGIHLHLEVTQNGSYVDPLEFLQSYGCNVPDESGCSNPR